MYATLPRCAALTASCSSGQHFASGFLQISPRDEHPCLPLTLPLTGCVEDFHLLVVLQPPQLKNSASHGAHTGSGDGGLTTAERQRLKELERENRELRRSNDILRQASAYFAKAEFDRLWKK